MFSGPIRGGTRGGQGDFKWTDVAADEHRENYLGHSLLAPVGRWQKNRDITWYNKQGGSATQEEIDEAERQKREELRRVKEAEEDALSVALGFAPAQRDPNRPQATSTNAAPLGEGGSGPGAPRAADKEARKAEKEAKRAAKEERRREKEEHRREKEERRREKEERKMEKEGRHEREDRRERDGRRDGDDWRERDGRRDRERMYESREREGAYEHERREYGHGRDYGEGRRRSRSRTPERYRERYRRRDSTTPTPPRWRDHDEERYSRREYDDRQRRDSRSPPPRER